MAPEQTIEDILTSIQRIAQTLTKETLFAELDKVQENLTNLRTWFENGGFKPNLIIDYTVEDLDKS